MLAGGPYDAADPELVADRRRCQEVLQGFNSRGEQELARSTLGGLLASVGDSTIIEPPFLCDYGYNISIGRDSFINYGGIVLDVSPVTIGDEVRIATRVQLLTSEHPLDPAERRAGIELSRPITIGDGAWIGGGVIVLPGVNIGDNAVIGAGSVVTEDIQPGVLAVGNPCRMVRSLA